jgi:Cu(I)-responsive transcriptional regulator
MDIMNIGNAADASGVSAKMIRHYETLGLIPKAKRTVSGYRTYSESDIHTLRFVRQARDLGFSTTEIHDLLGLWRNRRRPSSEVRKLAEAHLRELDQRLSELQAMRATIEHLVHSCHGDDRPECPILETLAAPPRADNRSAPRKRAGALRQGHRHP